MWLSELEILENEYQEYQKEREQAQIGEIKNTKKKTITKISNGVRRQIKKAELIEEEIFIEPKKKSVKKIHD
jgi:hypothetical protein